MKAHVLVFHAGLFEITTTTPPLTCGYIVLIVAICTTEGNSSAHFPPLPRVIPSPASWTWRLTLYHLLRMTRSDQIFTVNIPQFCSNWLLSSSSILFCFLSCFYSRSQSWHLKVWWPLNYTLVCCSTAVILERRYIIIYMLHCGHLLYIKLYIHTSISSISFLQFFSLLNFSPKSAVGH